MGVEVGVFVGVLVMVGVGVRVRTVVLSHTINGPFPSTNVAQFVSVPPNPVSVVAAITNVRLPK